MQTLRTLIDKASEMCGGDAKLAQVMGVYRSDISHWRGGKRPISPETAAILADLAHEDVDQAIRDAIIERNKGTRLEPVLRGILGKAIAAGVAGVLAFSYSASSISGTQMTKMSDDSIYKAIHRMKWHPCLDAARGLVRRAIGWLASLVLTRPVWHRQWRTARATHGARQARHADACMSRRSWSTASTADRSALRWLQRAARA